MSEHSDSPDWGLLRAQLIGLGETSSAKSYYPSLRRKAQELERFRVLVDESHDAILLLDAERYTIVDLNRQAGVLLGIRAAEATGLDATDFFPEELTRELEGMSSENGIGLRTDIVFPRNPLAVVEISARNVLFHGDRYLVIAARDVTIRRRTQEELERQVDLRTRELTDALSELRDASDAKSQFLANMSHELRTPLNSIIGFSGLMLEGMSGETTEEQQRQLAMISSAGKHLLTLINELLDLSRIEAGKIRVNPGEVLLDEILRYVQGLVSPLAQDRHLAVILESNTPDFVIYTDEERVREILLNLLSNAVKFTDQGTITITSSVSKAHVRVSVTDTGIGIDAADQELIWEPFSQLGVERDRHQGTGLGLGIAQRLAGLLGGEIELESAPGKGSTFTLVLPLRYE